MYNVYHILNICIYTYIATYLIDTTGIAYITFLYTGLDTTWIASSGVLASLLIISWTIFIVSCVVACCMRKRSKRGSDYATPSKGIYVYMCRLYIHICIQFVCMCLCCKHYTKCLKKRLRSN